MVLNFMTNHSEHANGTRANGKPILDSGFYVKLDNEIENRSGKDRRKNFDRRSKVGRRTSSDRRRRFSSPWELGWEGTKQGLSTETLSRFISASFRVFVEKTGR
jgi:hypothetical protein